MMKVPPAALIAAGLLIALPAHAGQFVYPLQGQDPSKQASDEADCAKWAAQQVGLPSDAQARFAPDGAATGAAGDASATAPLVLGALSGGQQGGPAGALGGGPGQAGTATDALVNNAGHVAGRQTPGVGGSAASAAGPAPTGLDKARAACLTARGYSVH